MGTYNVGKDRTYRSLQEVLIMNDLSSEEHTIYLHKGATIGDSNITLQSNVTVIGTNGSIGM